MILSSIQTSELGKKIREHITCILQMGAVRLNLEWTAEFLPEQILSCCGRMMEQLDCSESFPRNIQRELLYSPEFAPWLGQLMSLVEQAKTDTEAEEPSPSWGDLAQRLDELLETARDSEKSIATFSGRDTLFALRESGLRANTRLAYLKNFAPMELDDATRAQIVKNLFACRTVPTTLSDNQRALLAEPFVYTRNLFDQSDFEAVSALIQFCPELAAIARLLHQKGIDEELDLTDYQYFAEDGPEYLRLLTAVVCRLNPQEVSRFIGLWQRNNCTLSELRRMERRIQTLGAEELVSALDTYTGYINLLYGARFKTISLSQVNREQEHILIYAIIHNKKHFIRLVDENGSLFFRLSRHSILFQEELYRKHFNLNELTVKDLEDCLWMQTSKLPSELFQGAYQYTFPELKLLYDSPRTYVTLYHKLRTPRLDDRIKILRQLRKRNILRGIADESELTALAEKLDQKPLAGWQREEFGHIRDIRAEDAAQMLIHLNQLRPLHPGIRCRADVMLALRSLDYADRFDSIETLKTNLLEVDRDWLVLADDMELSSDFKTRHQDDIIKFLCRDGAGIARAYLDNLDDDLHPAFYRVVKAELMGQFSDLKYHNGDLERELDYPLDVQAKVEWKENLSLRQGGIEARERDDFFSTILLGTQPRKTCLSYLGGAYSSCLLACFDSNKKVLYAERNDQIVGRACIRLTKCCLTGAPQNTKGTAGRISFVDLEDENGSSETRHEGETLALFLECPYTSGLNPEEQLEVETVFVKLVQQKAEALGAVLVLSMDYRNAAQKDFAQTRLHLYISASKAGKQYLDSLGGSAGASSEGSYRANIFMLEQTHAQSEGEKHL